MWSRIFLFFLILNCNIHGCWFLSIDEDECSPGLGLGQHESMDSPTTVKQVLLVYFLQEEYVNVHLWISETQDGQRPCVSSGFYALLKFIATFSLMSLIRRLWAIMEYPPESGFNKKQGDGFNSGSRTTSQHQDVSALSPCQPYRLIISWSQF